MTGTRTPIEAELRTLYRRDQRLMQLIRDERNPRSREAIRREHREVVARIEKLEGDSWPCE